VSRPPVALYIHFPFCLSICPYCDFVVQAGRDARGPSNRIEAFVDAVVVEIGLRARPAPLSSIYLGGGTPSLMSAGQVARLLSAAERGFGIADGAEVTIEANPGPTERGDLAAFRAAGVNRLSVGAQSLKPTELRRLGRRHSPTDVVETVRTAREAGFENVSVDLLYDVPGQTLDSWRASLDATIALAPDHVSAYALSLDDPEAEGLTGPLGDHLPARPGARRWRERARVEQDEDRAAAFYEMADDVLGDAGYAWYELSNWAMPGKESRHNLTYWLGDAWEAVGPGAHAFDGERTRRWNAARIDAYLASLTPIADGSDVRLPMGASDTTDDQDAAADSAILRLRTRAGLPADIAGRPEFRGALAWARANGLLEPAADGLRLTRRGRLLSNEVFVRLLPGTPPAIGQPADAAA
jgi:oxygen-independent coproporphyrinogen-3 oxidase